MKSFQLSIITPEKVFFDGKIDMIILRGKDGDFAVMKDKSPLMSAIVPGKTRIFKDSDEKVAMIGSGYVRVYENDVTVVTEAANWEDEETNEVIDES